MSVVAVVALAGAIANSAASVGFPVGAGWERVVNILVTVDLILIAVVLIVAAVLTSRSQAAAPAPRETVIGRDGRPLDATPRVGGLAVVGLVMLAMDWILWLAVGLPALIGGLVAGQAAYLFVGFVSALFGPLWVIGTVMSVIGFHRGGSTRNRTLSLIGAVMTTAMTGLVVLVSALFATGVIG